MYDVFYSGAAPGIFAFERPASSIQDAARQSRTEYFWYIYGSNDYTGFNFTVKPAPWESTHTYVWGDQWQRDAGVYLVPTAHATNPVWNFRTEQRVTRLPSMANWSVPENIDISDFDFSWHPDPHEPAYTYHFPSQWQRASGLKYVAPNAQGEKFVSDLRVTALPDTKYWTIPEYIDMASVDFSWHPDATDIPARWHFPSQWQRASGLVYNTPGAVGDKFCTDFVATALQYRDNWAVPEEVDVFDFSWHPDVLEPAYLHVFPTTWQPVGGPVYKMQGATAEKYHAEPHAKLKADTTNWQAHYECEFDYSWRPHPEAPAYIYVFGNQWHPAEKMATVEYHVPGATERHYMSLPVAKLPETAEHWITLVDCEFDYSWCPDPGDPPYIYVFGNQWWPAEKMSTVEYHVPGATERKYLEEPRATLKADRARWTVPEELDDTKIDFSWVPDPGEPAYEYHWSDQYQVNTGLIYTVPGSKHIKILDEMPLLGRAEDVRRVVDIFFVDRYNKLSETRWQRIVEQYPTAQRIRYMNSMMDTIKRCAARSSTTRFWVISSLLDYTGFDFEWHPDTWQSNMTHVFGTAWQKWSDTYLINKHEFNRVSKWAKDLTEFPNLNFVATQTVANSLDNCDVYYIDHSNDTDELGGLRKQFPDIKVTRFVDNYLDTFKRIMSSTDKDYVWVTSSLCRYRGFDFSWHPEPWQAEMLHVFPSNTQRQGDTFYIPAAKFKDSMADLEILDWFNTINYCDEQAVIRIGPEEVVYSGDDVISAIRQHRFTQPYALFTTGTVPHLPYTPSIWRQKDRSVHVLSRGGSILMVPRDAQLDIQTQVYDYPHIMRQEQTGPWGFERPLDIVYISNGEPDAERWYEYLCFVAKKNVKRVQNVNGRVAAYQAAARTSDTPWFFAVFAKLEVDPSFDWNWQPDYLQGPKHYIFKARNPVNGLEYGHMAMIAYNKRLVLENNELGLDFTLRQPHASVPILSGVAHYNQDAWTTWRTAFREVIKLIHFNFISPSVDNEYRLKTWKTVAQGDFAEYSLKGAADAVEYYNSVGGELSKLMLSFDWDWLKDYYAKLGYCL